MKRFRLLGCVAVLALSFCASNAHADKSLCEDLPKLGYLRKHADYCERRRMPLPGTPDPDSFVLRRGADLDKEVTLIADIVMPKADPANPNKLYPAVVFLSSWAVDGGIEYMGAARKMAKKGYIVLLYTARGMQRSGGHVDVASKEDVQDARGIISWLVENTPVDEDNIGMAGISYGSGIGIMTLAEEPRLKTVVAMSTWGMLGDELYGQDTPDLIWTEILLLSSMVAGDNMTQTTWDIAMDLKDPECSEARIDEILEFAELRSPGLPSVIDKINARGAPVMISKNYHDELFTPNSSMKMFSALTVPKKLVLNEGIHASAEILGALGFKNFAFEKLYDWFDFWLKGAPGNNVMDPSETIIMELQGAEQGVRESYSDWPDSHAFNNQSFYLAPRGSAFSGDLQNNANSTPAVDTIRSGMFDTAATSGGIGSGDSLIGLISSPLVELVVKNPVVWLPSIPRRHGVVYQSSPVTETTKIRGMPNLELWVSPGQPNAQVVAYLYDTDERGWGTLITYGARTLHWAVPQEAIALDIEMNMAAYDLPQGHSLSLVLDTQDVQYVKAGHDWDMFAVDLLFSAGDQSVLTVPVAK
ncbi:MAG: CocE/NonD family hydrolase [Myxococcota bacterium]|jgi:putative CocE/NonD family hydrolase|nr:CocE/NonD family hydrolase [Myxococcota bacterium]